MLIHEFRIPMPNTVEEYRVAQRYMIAKKSLIDSQKGEGGVEIIENRPYFDGPGGSGQYTMKIYHVGSHMPGWIKSIMPKTALEVHEEAWNAYPYTKTIFSIPFVNKFSIDIETVYKGGRGTEHDNALNLTKSELAQREVFDINLLTTTPADPTDKGYEPLEDPAVYVSQRTGRGPLQPEWEKTHNPVMCAYKVCKVNFKYWGLQSKLENFIADVGLRRTIVGAHRQAWCWQDEWIDLNMEDVLKMEEEAQRKLAEVFAKPGDGTSADESTTALTNSDTRATAQSASASQDEGLDGRNTNLSILENVDSAPPLQKVYSSMTTDMDTDEATSGSDSVEFWSGNEEFDDADEDQYSESADPNSTAAGLPRLHLQPPSDSGVRRRHLVIASFAPSIISSSAGSDADWASDFNTFKRTVKQVAESHYSEGVDCMEIVPIRTGPILGEGTPPTMTTELEAVLRGMSKSNDLANFSPSALIGSVVMHPTYDSRLQEMVQVLNATLQHYSDFEFQGGSVTIICDRISGLLMYDVLSRPELCDQVHLPIDYCYTLGAPIGFVLGQRYLQSLAHTSTGVLRTPGPTPVRHTPHTLTATSSPSPLASTTVSMSATASTESGTGVPLFFEPDVNRQIPPLSPTTESKSAGGSANNTDADISTQAIGVPVLRAQPPQMPRCRQFFNVFHSADPLGYRLEDILLRTGCVTPTPLDTTASGETLGSTTSFKLHPSQPQPLSVASSRSSVLDSPCAEVVAYELPFDIPLYRQFPYGTEDPGPAYCCEKESGVMTGKANDAALQWRAIHTHEERSDEDESTLSFAQADGMHDDYSVRTDKTGLGLRHSANMAGAGFDSVQGQHDSLTLARSGSGSFASPQAPRHRHSGGVTMSQDSRDGLSSSGHWSVMGGGMSRESKNGTAVGPMRMDYQIASPDGVRHMTPFALLLATQGSYWTSEDLVAFLFRSIAPETANNYKHNPSDTNQSRKRKVTPFIPSQAVTPWLRSRSRLVVAGGAKPYHRAHDVLVKVGCAQVLQAKFSYGSVYSELVGEKVEVSVLTDPPHGKWKSLGTVMSGKRGKALLEISETMHLPVGHYPVTFLVKADHTIAECQLVVIEPKTEVVIFSIDGAFAASVSMSGQDPKVQAMSVDIVRAWSKKGYQVIYISSRPEMQYWNVVNWLARHNFPFGSVHFCGAVHARGPSSFKGHYLEKMIEENEMVVVSAYGSTKDVSAYKHIGVPRDALFVHGKGTSHVNYLPTGFTEEHLEYVMGRRAASHSAGAAAVATTRQRLNSLALKGKYQIDPVPNPPSRKGTGLFTPTAMMEKLPSFPLKKRPFNSGASTAPIQNIGRDSPRFNRSADTTGAAVAQASSNAFLEQNLHPKLTDTPSSSELHRKKDGPTRKESVTKHALQRLRLRSKSASGRDSMSQSKESIHRTSSVKQADKA